jgi:hypothetical protein
MNYLGEWLGSRREGNKAVKKKEQEQGKVF